MTTEHPELVSGILTNYSISGSREPHSTPETIVASLAELSTLYVNVNTGHSGQRVKLLGKCDRNPVHVWVWMCMQKTYHTHKVSDQPGHRAPHPR